MSSISDKDIDRLFKEAGSKASYPFDQDGWKSLNEQLSYASANALGYYKSVGFILLGLLAVIAIIFITLPQGKTSSVRNQGMIERHDEHSSETNTPKYESQSHNTLQASTESVKSASANSEISTAKIRESNDLVQSIDRDHSMAISKTADPHFLDRKHPDTGYQQPELRKIPDNNSLLVTLEKEEKVTKSPDQFAVKMSVAPDFSSIGYYSPGRSGFNVGLYFEYHLSKRWWVFTGAMLSKKYYSDNGETGDYGLYDNAKLDDASCRVIDVPLNAGYYLARGDKSKFYVTAGISSYFMLSESYTFTSVDYYGTREEWDQNYRNKNKHILGLVNFSFGFERKLSQNLSLQAEPFIKSPITDIGEGKISLVSGGVMVNLKYQFNRTRK